MRCWDFPFSLGSGMYQPISANFFETIFVSAVFSGPVYLMFLDPANFGWLISGNPEYRTVYHENGERFEFPFTPPWAGLWKVVVWNYAEPGKSVQPVRGTLRLATR